MDSNNTTYWYEYSNAEEKGTSHTFLSKSGRDSAAEIRADRGFIVVLRERTDRITGTLKPDPRAKLRNADIGTLWEKQRPDYAEPVRYVKIDNNKFMRIIGSSFTYSTAENIASPEWLTEVEEF